MYLQDAEISCGCDRREAVVAFDIQSDRALASLEADDLVASWVLLNSACLRTRRECDA